MKKSTMWSLAMALATSMSGGTSITNSEDDDSKPEETIHIKRPLEKFDGEKNPPEVLHLPGLANDSPD